MGKARARPDALFVIGLDNEDRRLVTFPPLGVGTDSDPAISPDGLSLVFRRDLTPFTGELPITPGGRPVACRRAGPPHGHQAQREQAGVDARQPGGRGLGASRDGRTIFFARVDSSADELMLVERFRSAGSGTNSLPCSREHHALVEDQRQHGAARRIGGKPERSEVVDERVHAVHEGLAAAASRGPLPSTVASPEGSRWRPLARVRGRCPRRPWRPPTSRPSRTRAPARRGPRRASRSRWPAARSADRGSG